MSTMSSVGKDGQDGAAMCCRMSWHLEVVLSREVLDLTDALISLGILRV